MRKVIAMRAVYMPAGAPVPLGVDLESAEDFFCLAEIVQAGSQGGVPPAIVMSDGSPTSLLCASTTVGVVIMISADNEHSYHGITLADDSMAPACMFDFLGTPTVVPGCNTVSMTVAQGVVAAYFDGGFPEAMRAAVWEPDWSGATPGQLTSVF
jgi:hypothetical protein